MMKIYTNPTCHYCNRLKTVLNEQNVPYEEINASENEEEWNEITRIAGIGMTPAVIFQDEIWLPNRDFRTPEELIGRVKHFTDNPMKPLKLEERLDQVHNTVKNLTLLLNQMSQTLQTLNSKVPQSVPPATQQVVPPQPQPQQ